MIYYIKETKKRNQNSSLARKEDKTTTEALEHIQSTSDYAVSELGSEQANLESSVNDLVRG